MTSMNISLPDSMRDWLDEQVTTGGYGTASEFVRELIRDAQKRAAQEKLEALLIEGLESGPPIEITEEYWKQLRARVSARLKNERSK